MTAYRRDNTPGATWFFTLNLAERQLGLLTTQVDLLRASFARVMGGLNICDRIANRRWVSLRSTTSYRGGCGGFCRMVRAA